MSTTRQSDAASPWRAPALLAVLVVLFVLEGSLSNALFSGSWNSALGILNMGLLSAIMALGVNITWGYGGLFNAGVVGFLALGGLAPVLVSTRPVPGAWAAGGTGVLLALLVGLATLGLAAVVARWLSGALRFWAALAVIVAGFVIYRELFDPAVAAIEANNPAQAGNIGGLGLPVLLSWPVGGLLAAAAAWGVGKVALGCGPTTSQSPRWGSERSSWPSCGTKAGLPAACST